MLILSNLSESNRDPQHIWQRWRWFILHRDVWLLDCISRDDRTGMSYLYGMGYVTCILYVKRKFRLIIFLTWVDLFPLSLNLACNYSWTGLNRRQKKLSKVGFKKLNLIVPTIHDMYKLFKKWFLIRSIKWIFISILFSIPPFIFQANKTQRRTDQNSLDKTLFQKAS